MESLVSVGGERKSFAGIQLSDLFSILAQAEEV